VEVTLQSGGGGSGGRGSGGGESGSPGPDTVAKAGNGAGPSKAVETSKTVPIKLGQGLVPPKDDIDRLLVEVRLLASHIQDANALRSGAADLERAATSLLTQMETLPGRIADAIAAALAKQHHMIIADVRSALRDRFPQ
jgi:hypothetical protein